MTMCSILFLIYFLIISKFMYYIFLYKLKIEEKIWPDNIAFFKYKRIYLLEVVSTFSCVFLKCFIEQIKSSFHIIGDSNIV